MRIKSWSVSKAGRHCAVATVMFLFACGIVSGATDMRKFPFKKEILMPQQAAKKVAIFRLDEQLFASTTFNYSNMRLFDVKGNEWPFLVRPAEEAKSETIENKVELEAVGFEKLTENRIELVYKRKENDADKQLSAVVLSTSLKNYEKQVTVSGSNDRSSWDILAENQPIFDYSKYVDLQNCRVAFQPGKYSYYRLKISNITETKQSPLVVFVRETRNGSQVSETERNSFSREDFRIDRVDFVEKKEALVKSRILKRIYPVAKVSITNDVKDKITRITFEAGLAPLTGLKIVTDSANFSRSVRVESPEKNITGDEVWQCEAVTVISRIDAGGFKRENVDINFSRPARCGQYRVTIHNQDSPPLHISGVEAEGEIHEAVFFPEQSAVFNVMYGAKGVDSPSYDIVEVLAGADRRVAGICSIGPQSANPVYNPASGGRTIEGRRLLVVAVLAVIGVLVWTIGRTIKNVDSSAST